MKKYILLIITMLFVVDCANFDFVYDTNKKKLNTLKNNTILQIAGDEADDIYAYLSGTLGSNITNNPNYKLSINSIRTEKAQVIAKDATASKFSIEYNIVYSLYNINKNCKIVGSKIITKDFYDSKSAGYSFGADLSKKEKNINILSKNIDQFISFISRYDYINKCNSEN